MGAPQERTPLSHSPRSFSNFLRQLRSEGGLSIGLTADVGFDLPTANPSISLPASFCGDTDWHLGDLFRGKQMAVKAVIETFIEPKRRPALTIVSRLVRYLGTLLRRGSAEELATGKVPVGTIIKIKSNSNVKLQHLKPTAAVTSTNSSNSNNKR